MVWEEGKRISKNALSFSRLLFAKSVIFDRQKSQYHSTDQLVFGKWRVSPLFRYFHVILGLLQ